jgi:hypothetical protein
VPELGGENVIPLPAWVDREAWDAFVSMRETDTRKPLTQRGAVRILKRLQAIKDAGLDPNDALDYSTDQRYFDVYPPKQLELPKAGGSADYQRTQERLKAEAERKASPPPARVLEMVKQIRRTA